MGCSLSKREVSFNSSNKTTNRVQDSEDADEFVEGVVCNSSDIKENEMKAFDLADAGRILLIKQNGKLSALGAKCTHYGAPLANGALGDGRIRCQWHGACFNILNGDIEDFPGLDSLPCYKVSVENDEIKVRARKSELISNKRQKSMSKRDTTNPGSIIVIGGGPAGATCVETLRQEGYQGQITQICKESCLPYDRVKVSKAMDFEIEKAQFRNDEFYKNHDITVLKGIEATDIQTTDGVVSLSNGQQLKYDRLFIATGCRPIKTNVPGADLKNVVVMRDHAHSVYVNAQLNEDKEVVVLGSSFIAMEAANYCLNKVKSVTLVIRGTVPFKPLLGEEIGGAFKALFEEKGVAFKTNSGIVRCIPRENSIDNEVGGVELIDGTYLNADLVIMGVGSKYYTDFLKNSGINMRDDGSIEVDDYLRTNVPNVFVGGDIAHAPVWSRGNRKSTIGHYPLAHYHGKIAALNMLDKSKKMEAVPFFWTMLFGKGVRYAGHGPYDDIIYTGDVKNLKFAAFYLDKDEVVAVSSCAMDPIVSQFAELLAQGKKLYRADIENDALGWTRKLTERG